MLDLLKKVFGNRLAMPQWQARIREIVPSYGPSYGKALNDDPDAIARTWASTAETLQLAVASPAMHVTERPRPAATRVKVDRSPDLAL